MPKPRKYTEEQFVEAVKESQSIRQLLGKLGLKEAGGNYAICKKRIADMDLDVSHFGTIKDRQGWAKGKKFQGRYVFALEEILVENRYFQTYKLKQRLIESGHFEAICSGCKLDKWMEQPIPLELDHMNGKNDDNRIENLRLLCPNCHAQTTNYRGKNKSSL